MRVQVGGALLLQIETSRLENGGNPATKSKVTLAEIIVVIEKQRPRLVLLIQSSAIRCVKVVLFLH